MNRKHRDLGTLGVDVQDAAGEGPLWDLGIIPDTPEQECGGSEGGGGFGGGVELSYIWISNSSQQTISKIDTVTMVEEGRYRAKVANGDPSRTSVNLLGDVAVANRNGGVAKFWADPADCIESNGTPGIQTSSGGGDILAWEDEECRAWYTDFVCGSNRPVASSSARRAKSSAAFRHSGRLRPWGAGAPYPAGPRRRASVARGAPSRSPSPSAAARLQMAHSGWPADSERHRLPARSTPGSSRGACRGS